MKRCILLFLSLALLACVPTPEEEIIINKGDNTLEILINATAAPTEEAPKTDAVPTAAPMPQPYEAPQRVTETYDLGIGDAKVVFDAPVTVPFSDHYKVYEVSKGTPTVKQVQNIVRAFFGDAPLYAGQYVMTKAEYAALLKYCDESPAVAEKNRNMKQFGFDYTVQYFIKDEMDTAPLERTDKPYDLHAATFLIRAYGQKYGGGVYYNVFAGDHDEYNYVTICPDNFYLADERLVYSGTYPGSPSGRRLDELSLTREDAIAAAQVFLDDAGIDWVTLSYAETIPAEYSDRLTDMKISQGWKLVYHHSYNGVTGVNQKYSGTLSADQYQAPWPQETVYLYVDSEGVRYFEWVGMSTVEEIRENELVIKPFDDMLKLIRRKLKVENAYAEADQTREIRVTGIELGYCVIPKKNDASRGYTVPAWIVRYEEETLLDGKPHTYYHDFVIDAVTGANIQTAVP